MTGSIDTAGVQDYDSSRAVMKGRRIASEAQLALGARLRVARKRLRLSQSVVATFLETSRQTVAGYERGVRQPGLSHLVGLSNIYRHTLDELMESATSALRATQLPRFHARFNEDKDLAEHDRHELATFTAYLQHRPRTHEFVFQQRSFETVAETARRWSTELGVEKVIPVPVFPVLARCGIEVRVTALERLAGALIMGDAEHAHGVLINADQPHDRQRYSAAHEAGHLVLGHEAPTRRFISYRGRRFDPVEVHADQFAAEFLVPADLLKVEAAKLPDDENLPEQIYRLAAKFMVSYQAMTTRLVKLGALSPQAAEQVSKERPSDVAKRLRLSPRGRQTSFKEAWLPKLVERNLPKGWHRRASIETVRLLQETAYQYYVEQVPDQDQADDAAAIYQTVALWVARKYPLVTA